MAVPAPQGKITTVSRVSHLLHTFGGQGDDPGFGGPEDNIQPATSPAATAKPTNPPLIAGARQVPGLEYPP